MPNFGGYSTSYASDSHMDPHGGSVRTGNHGNSGEVVIGPYTAFERQHYGAGGQNDDNPASVAKGGRGHHDNLGGVAMTQSITQLFAASGAKSGGIRSGDDGGYAKPSSENFGSASHGGDFGGDFSKVDFDKPLFDFK